MLNLWCSPRSESPDRVARHIAGYPQPVLLIVGGSPSELSDPGGVISVQSLPRAEEYGCDRSRLARLAVILVLAKMEVPAWRWLVHIANGLGFSPIVLIGGDDWLDEEWYQMLAQALTALRNNIFPTSMGAEVVEMRPKGTVLAFVRQHAVFMSNDRVEKGWVARHVRWLCALGNACAEASHGTSLADLSEASVYQTYTKLRNELDKSGQLKTVDAWEPSATVQVGSTTVQVDLSKVNLVRARRRPAAKTAPTRRGAAPSVGKPVAQGKRLAGLPAGTVSEAGGAFKLRQQVGELVATLERANQLTVAIVEGVGQLERQATEQSEQLKRYRQAWDQVKGLGLGG